MITRMAKKSHTGDYDHTRHHDFGARGGGGRRAKPLLQGSWRKLEDQVEGMNAETQARNRLSPRGLVGLILYYIHIIGYDMKKCVEIMMKKR